MVVGCSRIWGLKPTTQTQVSGKAHERQHTKHWDKQSHEYMRRRKHNMRRSRWPLELPEDATEKRHTEIIHAHTTDAASTPPQNTNKP